MEEAPPSYSEVVKVPNYCSNCGNKLDESFNKCTSCGTIILIQSQPMPISNFLSEPAIEIEPVYPAVTNTPTPRTTMPVVINNRLIIDFEKVSCCPWDQVGVHEYARESIPEELALKGITPAQWRDWMMQLNDIQKLAPSVAGCLCIFCFPALCLQSILCAVFCPVSADHPFSFLPCCYGDWYAKLKKWQDEVNKVLNRVEMHAKLLTYKPFNHAPRSKHFLQRTSGKDGSYEMSFLVIALNRQESEKLMLESWYHGVSDDCTWTSGRGRCL